MHGIVSLPVERVGIEAEGVEGIVEEGVVVICLGWAWVLPFWLFLFDERVFLRGLFGFDVMLNLWLGLKLLLNLRLTVGSFKPPSLKFNVLIGLLLQNIGKCLQD